MTEVIIITQPGEAQIRNVDRTPEIMTVVQPRFSFANYTQSAASVDIESLVRKVDLVRYSFTDIVTQKPGFYVYWPINWRRHWGLEEYHRFVSTLDDKTASHFRGYSLER